MSRNEQLSTEFPMDITKYEPVEKTKEEADLNESIDIVKHETEVTVKDEEFDSVMPTKIEGADNIEEGRKSSPPLLPQFETVYIIEDQVEDEVDEDVMPCKIEGTDDTEEGGVIDSEGEFKTEFTGNSEEGVDESVDMITIVKDEVDVTVKRDSELQSQSCSTSGNLIDWHLETWKIASLNNLSTQSSIDVHETQEDRHPVIVQQPLKTHNSLLTYQTPLDDSCEKPYVCELCHYGTPFKGDLQVHMSAHTGEKPYACQLCPYKTIRKGYLKIHMSIHSVEKPFACELCRYRSATDRELKRHMLSVHTGEKPYSCESCDFKTTNKVSLKVHASSVHSVVVVKRYACEFCSYKTTRKGYLKTHMSNHAGCKSYACDLCRYKSAHKYELKRHMSVHTGEKLFACELCDFKTMYKKNFQRHFSIHAGEKPYACELCDYKSAYKHVLKRHMSMHTN